MINKRETAKSRRAMGGIRHKISARKNSGPGREGTANCVPAELVFFLGAFMEKVKNNVERGGNRWDDTYRGWGIQSHERKVKIKMGVHTLQKGLESANDQRAVRDAKARESVHLKVFSKSSHSVTWLTGSSWEKKLPKRQ